MKTLFQSFKVTIIFAFILFTGYVLILCLFSTIVSPSNGSAQLLTLNGRTVGAANVGQSFTDSIYFWGRPSAVDFDGSASGGSNKGLSNPEYLTEVESRIEAFLAAHPYLDRSQVPSSMVTASGSGLDPHISPNAASVQIKRVAAARGMSEASVISIVDEVTERPIVGQAMVNVLKLNIALDEK